MVTKKPATKPAAKTVSDVTPVNSDNLPTVAQQRQIVNFNGFVLKKRVTLPSLTLKENQPVVLRIDDAFRESKVVNPAKPTEKKAIICGVTDMQTGEVSTLLVPTVMHKNLMESYPDDSYVGKIFGVQKLPKRPSKRHNDMEIVELEMDETGAD